VDSHYRSIVKTISYRVFGAFVTGFVAWAVTGKAGLGALVGIVDTTVKIAVYYMHERIWNRVDLGRTKPPEYEI